MIVHQKTGKTEKSEIKKCILTIGEKTVPAVLEKEQLHILVLTKTVKN